MNKRNGKYMDNVGNQYWYKNGLLHRNNAPAVIMAPNGAEGQQQKEWYKNGERHRKNGPAVITEDGDLIWFIEGKLIKYVITPDTKDHFTDEEFLADFK